MTDLPSVTTSKHMTACDDVAIHNKMTERSKMIYPWMTASCDVSWHLTKCDNTWQLVTLMTDQQKIMYPWNTEHRYENRSKDMTAAREGLEDFTDNARPAYCIVSNWSLRITERSYMFNGGTGWVSAKISTFEPVLIDNSTMHCCW